LQERNREPSNEQLIARTCRNKLWLALRDGAGEVAGDTTVALPAGKTPALESGLERNPSALDVQCSTFLHLIPLIAWHENALPPFAVMGGRRPRRRLMESYHQAECAAKEQVALR
jgi:hypothetical protein